MFHVDLAGEPKCAPACAEVQLFPAPLVSTQYALCEAHGQWWMSMDVDSTGWGWFPMDIVPFAVLREYERAHPAATSDPSA